MFDNIGGKIKGLAKVICWIGIIASCIGGIIYWVAASKLHAGFVGFLAGLGIIVGGSLASWIGSFTTYALGELVENSAEIRENTDLILKIKGIENPEALKTAKIGLAKVEYEKRAQMYPPSQSTNTEQGNSKIPDSSFEKYENLVLDEDDRKETRQILIIFLAFFAVMAIGVFLLYFFALS